jgi:thiosulfate dehydrogenase [quinone] large subunit
MSRTRQTAVGLGVLAAVLIFILEQPWFTVDPTVSQALTVVFWFVFVVLLIVLFQDRREPAAEEVNIGEPAFARFLFHNTQAGLFWLPIRLYVGFAWLEAGWHKLQDPRWTQGGEALRGYWERAVTIPDSGSPPITYDWYRDFINWLLANNAESWFAWVIILGEIAIGLGLLSGTLTGIAAFFGALMNMSFMLAGSGSSNPVMFTLAIGLVLAWRVAGWYGLDRWLLPALGTPWQRGPIASTGGAQPGSAPG